jgi:hypothetical protein
MPDPVQITYLSTRIRQLGYVLALDFYSRAVLISLIYAAIILFFSSKFCTFSPVNMEKIDKFKLPVDRRVRLTWLLLCLASVAIWTQWTLLSDSSHLLASRENLTVKAPKHANSSLERCRRLKLLPGPPDDFASRKVNDRFEQNTQTVWIKNATIWTGNDDGSEVLHSADIILDNGLIRAIGDVEQLWGATYQGIEVIDANGAWITPGYLLNLVGT